MPQTAALPLSILSGKVSSTAKVHANQKVLIHAGAGGVGPIAVQVARAFGAEVFATVSPDKKKIVERD
jgi:NADPH:quinone reductase-like Zn-dependent oxidoreductase